MNRSESLTVEKKCPMCGAQSTPYKYESVRIAEEDVLLGLNNCGNCNLHYISPRLSDDGLKLLYDNSYLSGTVSGHYNTNEEVSHYEYLAFKDYVLKYRSGAQEKLLDVGCGVGNFLDILASVDNLAVEGVEFSDFAFKKALDKGHLVRKGDLLELDYPESSFDFIAALYVLEHVPNPFDVIKKAFALLRPGGYLILAVPNLRYLNLVNNYNFLRFLTGREKTLHPQEHLQNFTPITIKRMVEAAGFTVEAQEMARPLRTGASFVQVAKSAAWVPLMALHRMGYTVGGIHLIARKEGSEEAVT